MKATRGIGIGLVVLVAGFVWWWDRGVVRTFDEFQVKIARTEGERKRAEWLLGQEQKKTATLMKERSMGLPPINVFKQRVAALNQLTTMSVAVGGGGAGTFGRTMGSYLFLGAGLEGVPTDAIRVSRLDDSDFALLGGATSYECLIFTPEFKRYAIWKADSLSRQGASNSSLLGLKEFMAANPESTRYILSLNGGYDVTAPAATRCPEEGDPYHWLHADDMWGHEVPVSGEYIVDTNPGTWDNRVGATINTLDDTGSDQSLGVGSAVVLTAKLHINGLTPFAPIPPRLRQGATILGAWGQVKISTLEKVTINVNFEAETVEDPSGYYSWSVTASAPQLTRTVETTALTGFFIVGCRDNAGVITGMKVLGQVSTATSMVATDAWTWVDLTDACQTMFTNWNGPYTHFYLLPYLPDSLNMSLSSELAGTEGLNRLMPVIAKSASIGNDGMPTTFSYSGNATMFKFTNVEIQNLEVAFQLPTTSVATLLNYEAFPSLVP